MTKHWKSWFSDTNNVCSAKQCVLDLIVLMKATTVHNRLTAVCTGRRNYKDNNYTDFITFN